MVRQTEHAMEKSAIRAAMAWGWNVERIRGDLPLHGSPERTEYRCVAECTDHRLVVLETIREKDLAGKQSIIERLGFLSGQGLTGILPYMKASDGTYISNIEGRFWQASPYVQGMPLDRPGYAFDGWRGEAMADFLIRLRKSSCNLPGKLCTAPFSILKYIDKLMGKIKIHEPGLLGKLYPITAFLHRHISHAHGLLPVAFCHGDYHPLNMIWSGEELLGVIDWEFSGIKPENYDAALLIGCIGMEDPDALAGYLVREFIRCLKDARFLSEKSWRVLLEMIIAIRFAWLSEWLRNRDTEMIELETLYMQLLIDNAEDIRTLWDYQA